MADPLSGIDATRSIGIRPPRPSPHPGLGARSEPGAEGLSLLDDDPLWYKDAVIYELHVKSFADSDGDGVGDFPGLTARLDYLQELGVTALWILPFYPSPLRDDGYDIADYYSVNPTYGTMEDFQEFLDEAHGRGLRVITELVINHTSDQHPWFQQARRAPRGSPERDFYVWSDDPEKYGETRIIFQDYEPSNWTWDPVAEQYFWHRFFHHQPDLNFDNPEVHEKLFEVMDYWLEMGVDGLRLDAIPYLYEREGTNCENLPETHDFLKKLRAHVDERFDSRMLLAEANQWPEDAAEYFGDGDECHMNFHFPIMPRLFMALRMEDRFPIVDILEQTPEIPDTNQWAIFLRNHDELTLEMVTDEERDYMYRVYAHDPKARINLGIRRRLAPLLENLRRKIELMNSLLLSLPGTPVLYYGDEIGMGDNFYLGDRHGVRTPMQWSGDRNAGFSEANPQRLFLPVIIDPEYHYESVNVETQHENPSSLLWWMRRIIALRRRHRAFGRGTFRWVEHDNKRVLAFLREYEGERLMVVANLSRFSQPAELDLSEFRGHVPVELFGQVPFPPVTEGPYRLTLAPHSFYWFLLRPQEALEPGSEEGFPGRDRLPRIKVAGSWEDVFRDGALPGFEKAVLPFLRRQRWFAGKGNAVRTVRVADVVPVPLSENVPARRALLSLVDVDYVDADAERYLLPLSWASGEEAERRMDVEPATVVARVEVDQVEGILFDAAGLPEFGRRMLATIRDRRQLDGGTGRLVGTLDAIDAFPADVDAAGGVPLEELEVRLGSAEQTNTSVIFGNRWILKLFRRLEEGINLDRELGNFLTTRGFEHTPDTAGGLEYRTGSRARSTTSVAAVAQRFTANEGDAWEYTLDALGRYFENALASPSRPGDIPLPSRPLVDALDQEIPDAVLEVVEEGYLDNALLLGRRTGELHEALGGGTSEDFAPREFTSLYQRSLYQSMRNLLGQTFRTLEGRIDHLEGDAATLAEELMGRRGDLLERFRRVLEHKMDGQRLRTHGDLHLGQVLFTGKDFVFIDFEGEPARPLGERRLKRSPLRDVAGMLRSFHYAVVSGLIDQRERAVTPSASEAETLERWSRVWHRWVSVAYMQGYLDAAGDAPFLPSEKGDRALLLDVFLLEKALYELAYELNNRPGWATIPLKGVLDLLGPREGGDGTDG